MGSMNRAQEGGRFNEGLARSSSLTNREPNKQHDIANLYRPKTIPIEMRYTPSVRDYPRRRLNMTEAEVQARREKDLCFRCDEKYFARHRCKKELQIMIVHEDERDEENEGEEEVITNQMTEEPVGDVSGTVELSLNSMLGLTLPGTMKIQGRLGPNDVTVLIDCRATHNFLCVNLIEELKLALSTTANYGVIMGTGMVVEEKRFVKELF